MIYLEEGVNELCLIDSLKQELLEFPGILNLQIFPEARRMRSSAFSIP